MAAEMTKEILKTEAKGREEAERIIEESIERYKEYYGKYKFL